MSDQIKTSRRFKVVLACSLALNLLVAGMVAGAAWRHGGDRGGGWRSAPPALQGYAAPYVRALPQAQRRSLHKAIRQSSSREERRAAYQDMLGALRAEPFDAQAVRALLTAQRDRVLAAQSAGQTQWIALVEAMTPQERAAYADQLEETLKKRRSRKGKRGRE